jgi:hypothetical protein
MAYALNIHELQRLRLWRRLKASLMPRAEHGLKRTMCAAGVEE